MARSRFDSFNSFIRKRRRLIIIAWVVALLLSLTFIPTFFSSVSYNIANTNFGGSKNTESQIAQNILNTQFPSSNNSGDNSIILVVQTQRPDALSSVIKNSLLSLNKTLGSDRNEVNYTSMSSIYSIEHDLLNSTVPGFLLGVAALDSNITTINKSLYSLVGNLSALSNETFALKTGINQTAQLIYGIPAAFVGIWSELVSSGKTPSQANTGANNTLFPEIKAQGNQSLGYYSLFYNSWNSTFNSLPNSEPVLQRETVAVNNTVALFVQNPGINGSSRALILSVAEGLNVTSWSQESAIANLTINTLSLQLPSRLASSLGTTSKNLVTDLFVLGPNPGNASLSRLAVKLISMRFLNNPSFPALGFSVSALVNESYSLGPSPGQNATWSLASKFFSNVTAASFASSPLFTINSTSLYALLSGLSNSSSRTEIQRTINNLISTQNFVDYPLVISNSLTKNFVNSKNDTMIVLFNFSSQPSLKTINGFRGDVKNSNLTTLATTYVTGSSVLSQDVQDAFTPALGVTVIPGVIVSILIVGLLFFAPLAALIPLLIGGLSIAIAYSSIYVGVVLVGHGQITFLTPTLTTLLMLGLAVDYSVLQLRRTKEERVNDKTKEESVAISVRWAGEAVITAGLTVIVAYIVMAVANVPLFSDVGTAIALGVSILLLASMTLLPSLELSIGDKLFWPGLRGKRRASKNILERISEGTLRRKVLVAVVITLFAAGAVYIAQGTPTGVDLLKLIPNFESNQGLSVITNSLGSSTIAPTIILMTTATPITWGNNQFNTTLLNQIEMISSTAARSPGIVSITSPTRPYGSAFNYSSVQNMSEPLRTQYLSGMLSQIGKDNKTALISVGLASSSESASAITSLLQMEKNVKGIPLEPGVSVYYGGATQSTYDSQSFINGILPQVIIILAAAVYVILLLQLRSVFTPLRLVFTILCSVSFALALLSISFYYAQNLPILDFAPLFVVVTMLGVGIDYDIFFVTRIREEVLNGQSDNNAIKTATSKIWVTILGLGLVLSSVFGSLLVTGIGLLQEISLAVASAVLIDVSVVILFFVPSLMGLAQKFNWWPSKIGRNSKRK